MTIPAIPTPDGSNVPAESLPDEAQQARQAALMRICRTGACVQSDCDHDPFREEFDRVVKARVYKDAERDYSGYQKIETASEVQVNLLRRIWRRNNWFPLTLSTAMLVIAACMAAMTVWTLLGGDVERPTQWAMWVLAVGGSIIKVMSIKDYPVELTTRKDRKVVLGRPVMNKYMITDEGRLAVHHMHDQYTVIDDPASLHPDRREELLKILKRLG